MQSHTKGRKETNGVRRRQRHHESDGHQQGQKSGAGRMIPGICARTTELSLVGGGPWESASQNRLKMDLEEHEKTLQEILNKTVSKSISPLASGSVLKSHRDHTGAERRNGCAPHVKPRGNVKQGQSKTQKRRLKKKAPSFNCSFPLTWSLLFSVKEQAKEDQEPLHNPLLES